MFIDLKETIDESHSGTVESIIYYYHYFCCFYNCIRRFLQNVV